MKYRTIIGSLALALLLAGASFATEQLADSEQLACTACHDKPGSKRLTNEGKYFELMRSMDGYADLEASFGNCTFCHRRKPGSKKLTPAGKGFANTLGNMEELVEWVRTRHPGWPDPGDSKEPPEPTGEPESADQAPEAASGSGPPMLPAQGPNRSDSLVAGLEPAFFVPAVGLG